MIDHRRRRVPLEVATFSGESMLKAQAQGAARVELNAPGSYPLGGTTPPVNELARVVDKLHIPVRIMIRPRGPPADSDAQDFLYSDREIGQMADSIREFKATGLLNPLRGDGFVFGLLKPRGSKPEPPILSATASDLKKSVSFAESFTGSFMSDESNPAANATDSFTTDGTSSQDSPYEIDTSACRKLIELAKPFGCVFHRAFDPIAAAKRASDGVETLIGLGFEGLLTAGGYGSSIDNIDRLDHLCHRMAGRIQIVVGGGLRAHNVGRAAEQLAIYDEGSVWLHTAALSKRPDHGPEDIDSDQLGSILAQLTSVAPA